MVLPPSTAHDAPRPGEATWLEPLKLALGLSRSGLLLLVDHARPALLGELVRALLPEHPELEVHTEAQRVLEVPHGSTLVLAPRAEDADWLNLLNWSKRRPGTQSVSPVLQAIIAKAGQTPRTGER